METLLPPGRSSVVNGHLWSFLQKVLFLSSSSCGDKMMDSPKERFNPGYVLHYSPPPLPVQVRTQQPKLWKTSDSNRRKGRWSPPPPSTRRSVRRRSRCLAQSWVNCRFFYQHAGSLFWQICVTFCVFLRFSTNLLKLPGIFIYLFLHFLDKESFLQTVSP